MAKRRIKIVILFILLVAVLIGVGQLYKKLEYNKESSLIDIYNYVSPEAVSIVNINREYNLDKLYTFDPSLKELIGILNGDLSFPTVIAQYANNEKILITKVKQEQEVEINSFIKEHIALPYPAKEKEYRNAKILFYSLPSSNFLVCTFYKGLFAMSMDYKPIQNFIDSDPENTFFSNEENIELITKMRNSAPVCLFIKINNNTLALDYQVQNDSIELSGYILNNIAKDSTNNAVIPYMIHLSDSICIDSIDVSNENKPATVKIFLNKKF
ncbi:MAG: hypothetical protein LBU84_11530 [Prevotella sp.]|jgi:hypothetical protein|nr:hypothetical protein [Prevotella sp.]